jgi:hypothetical protein
MLVIEASISESEGLGSRSVENVNFAALLSGRAQHDFNADRLEGETHTAETTSLARNLGGGIEFLDG